MSPGSRRCRRRTKSAPPRKPPIKVGLPYTYTGSFDTAGTHDDGPASEGYPRRRRRHRRRPARRRRQLRRRRLRHPVEPARHDRSRSASDRHRQGQLRHSRVSRRRDPLFRHAAADGRLRTPGASTPARKSSAAAAARRATTLPPCARPSTTTRQARARRWR